MGDTAYKTETLESVVLGTAENQARDLGLTLEPAAMDLLLRTALKALDKAHEEGVIEARRDELQHNTARLIRFVATEYPEFDRRSGVIGFKTLDKALAAFCRMFPDFYPFCPYP